MPVKRGRGFGASFGEVFPQAQAGGMRLVDTADDSKPSGAGGSGNASTLGEQKAA